MLCLPTKSSSESNGQADGGTPTAGQPDRQTQARHSHPGGLRSDAPPPPHPHQQLEPEQLPAWPGPPPVSPLPAPAAPAAPGPFSWPLPLPPLLCVWRSFLTLAQPPPSVQLAGGPASLG